MAVSVDTVYQRVLALANKEQRGYITPQEFNLLANQAQMAIFESYFYAMNIRERQEPDPDHHTSESNITELIGRKLGPFSDIVTVTSGHTFPTTVTIGGTSRAVYQHGRIFHSGRQCFYQGSKEINDFLQSVRHQAAGGRDPIWTDAVASGQDIAVYNPALVTSGVTAEVFGVPKKAEWAYVVVNDVALYNSSVAVDFELHPSEEDTLVIKILELAGIVMNKPGIVDIAAKVNANEEQFQKI
jgi:hypothetical protein